MTMLDTRRVTGGVDTHLDVHVAAALDPLGGLIGTKSFEVNPAGYKSLLSWLESFGAVGKVGVEGNRFLTEPGWRAFFTVTASMSSRSTSRTEPNGVGRASPIPSMQWKPRDQRSMAEQRVSPRQKTAQSRRSGSSSSPSAPPDRLGSKPSSKCVTWSSLLPTCSIVA